MGDDSSRRNPLSQSSRQNRFASWDSLHSAPGPTSVMDDSDASVCGCGGLRGLTAGHARSPRENSHEDNNQSYSAAPPLDRGAENTVSDIRQGHLRQKAPLSMQEERSSFLVSPLLMRKLTCRCQLAIKCIDLPLFLAQFTLLFLKHMFHLIESSA